MTNQPENLDRLQQELDILNTQAAKDIIRAEVEVGKMTDEQRTTLSDLQDRQDNARRDYTAE